MDKQLTRGQAIAFYDSGAWKDLPHEELASLMLYQEYLCIPFDVGREAVEKVLGRPVWSHEFAYADALRAEWKTGKKPTIEEIIGMIPEEKRIVVLAK